jgi:CheY-like chemotaxis protein
MRLVDRPPMMQGRKSRYFGGEHPLLDPPGKTAPHATSMCHYNNREYDNRTSDHHSGTIMNDLRECVLIVDDDVLIADQWSSIVEDMGLEVCGTGATAAVAIALAQEHRPKVVLMDMRLRGELDGVDAAIAIHELVGSKVIFITGSKELATTIRIQLDHPTAVLFKPVSDRQLQIAVRAAMEE